MRRSSMAHTARKYQVSVSELRVSAFTVEANSAEEARALAEVVGREVAPDTVDRQMEVSEAR